MPIRLKPNLQPVPKPPAVPVKNTKARKMQPLTPGPSNPLTYGKP